MSSIFEIPAELRDDQGKGASRRLRRKEQVPAILYGAHQDPVTLSIPENVVRKAVKQEAFYSHILTIDINGKKEQAVLKAVHRHPYKPVILHMDFLRITADQFIHMHVPLHFENEDKAPGVKAGGIISHYITDVEIKCLPKDLPEFLTLDLGSLNIDQILHLSDIKLPKGVQFISALDKEHDHPVVAIHLPRAEKAAEEVVIEEATPEAGNKSES